MMFHRFWLLGCTLALGLSFVAQAATPAESKGTQLIIKDGKAQLLYQGKPYLIKGAGGSDSKEELVKRGGNSFRTWGVDNQSQAQLDEAEKLGLTVTLGFWLGHKEHGFDYNDPVAVKKQFEDVKRGVLKYKDHPALLMWCLGNEMETNGNDNPTLWKAIEDLAIMVKEIDPKHPIMTVVAEIGGDKVQNIHKYCPHVDIVGINSYGGGGSITERYLKAGGRKPIVITEFGPPGTWEMQLRPYGAAPELTSTRKADFYRATYEKSVLAYPHLCLGSYAFTWGHKIEATSTWYGMFLPDGSKVAAVDTMSELWTGKPVTDPCPVMNSVTLVGSDQVKAGDTVHAKVEVSDPQGQPLKIEWALYREMDNYDVQGASAAATPSYPEAIVKNGEKEVTIKLPKFGGIYRIYCYARNKNKSAAVGSLPLKAEGPAAVFKPAAAKLPLYVISDKQVATPFVPSGWMGNISAINMDGACSDKPHTGKTCVKFEYTARDNWAGVVWQSPAGDWGEKAGGLDFSAAKKFVIWARGAKGGEQIKFGLGIIGSDKKYPDSAKVDTGTVTLTTEWKKFTIDLAGKDLSCIKSGFYWSLGGQGEPVTFYLADVGYE